MNGSSLRIGSTFTGAGGLDMALRLLWPDASTAWYSEIDSHAAGVFEHHHPDVPNLGSITDIDWSQVEPVDVLVGGFPCQDISKAGKRAGIKEGTRSGLWFRLLDAALQLRPRLLLVENVSAITTADGGLGVVLGSLAEAGWDAEWACVRASDVGAPHRRDRWFCVAYPHEQRPVDGQLGVVADVGRLQAQPDVAEGGAADHLLATPAAWDGRRGPDFARRNRDGSGGDDLTTQIAALLPTPVVTDSFGARNATSGRSNPDSQHHAGTTLNDVRVLDTWGEYEAAITRWGHLLGRPAPAPTTDGKLSPDFVEWMMGWPEGWTAPAASRTQRLKMLGNGVVPQQAAYAYSHLLSALHAEAAA